MDKRELKKRLKNIVGAIDNCIIEIEEYDKKFMDKTEKKIDELCCYLENHCIVPNSFHPEEMLKDIVIDYFNHDNKIIEIRREIVSLTEDVYEHLTKMNEGSTKKEWERLYQSILFMEEIINFKEQETKNVEEVINCINILK